MWSKIKPLLWGSLRHRLNFFRRWFRNQKEVQKGKRYNLFNCRPLYKKVFSDLPDFAPSFMPFWFAPLSDRLRHVNSQRNSSQGLSSECIISCIVAHVFDKYPLARLVAQKSSKQGKFYFSEDRTNHWRSIIQAQNDKIYE